MANRESYLEFLMEQLAPLGDVTIRRMFGGHAVYCNGTVFALVANDALYLKADDTNRPSFTARHLEPLHPLGDHRVSMQYYEAPPEIFEDSGALLEWVGGAVAAGRRARVKKKPGKVAQARNARKKATRV